MGKESIEQAEAIELGDTVRFDEPYSETEHHGGTYTHGIVVEIITDQQSHGERKATGVSVHPYNPSTRTIDVLPQSPFGRAGVPEHVDMSVVDLTLIHKATTSASEVKNEDGNNNTIDENVPDERALWTALVPHLNELDEQEKITSPTYMNDQVGGPALVMFSPENPDEDEEHLTTLLRVARRIGWEIVEGYDEGESNYYTLAVPEQKRLYE